MTTPPRTVAGVETGGRARAAQSVEQELVVLLRRSRARLEQVAREVHPDLEAAAYGILHLVSSPDTTTVTDLATRLGIGKPTVSRQVSALERVGLLERRPSDVDRRSIELVLTPEGERRLGEARSHRQEQLRRLLDSWDVEDVAELARLLAKFNAADW